MLLSSKISYKNIWYYGFESDKSSRFVGRTIEKFEREPNLSNKNVYRTHKTITNIAAATPEFLKGFMLAEVSFSGSFSFIPRVTFINDCTNNITVKINMP